MIQRAEKEVFGYFLLFGLLDGLDTGYCERTKWFSIFGNVTRPRRIIQKPQKYIFELFKEPKKIFTPFPGVGCVGST